GMVDRDGAVGDAEAAAGADEDTTPEAVAARAAEAGVAAIRLVVGDRAATDGDDGAVGRVPQEHPAGHREAAAPGIAAVGSRAAGAAESLVVAHRAVGKGRGRNDVHREAATRRAAAPGPAAAGPTAGLDQGA